MRRARDLAARSYLALVHGPVRDRNGRTVTTAVTNLDVHDVARSARTYGLAGYFVCTPVAAQRAHVQALLDHWRHDPEMADHVRREALAGVHLAHDLAGAVAAVATACGRRPFVVATSAVPRPGTCKHEELPAKVGDAPLCLVFGTGWGLVDEVVQGCDAQLEPIDPGTGYNHLSVRSAVAVILDRLYGREAC